MNLLEIPALNEFIVNFSWLVLWKKADRASFRRKMISSRYDKESRRIINILNKKNLDYPYFVFNLYYSMGDAYLISSYIKAFKEKNKCQVVVLAKKSYSDFIKTLQSINENVIDIDAPVNLDSFNKFTNDNLKLYKSFVFHPNLEKKLNHFGELSFDHLELNEDSKRETPIFNEFDINVAKNKFYELGLKQDKTIFLTPYALTFDYNDLSIDFWCNLADKFIEKGYNVVFNTKENDINFNKYKTIFLPINQAIPFIELCNASISFRSGFTDIMAGCNIENMSVIYPSDCRFTYMSKSELVKTLKKTYNWDLNKSDEENIFSIHSLNKMFNRNNIDELIFNKNENELLSYFINKYCS